MTASAASLISKESDFARDCVARGINGSEITKTRKATATRRSVISCKNKRDEHNDSYKTKDTISKFDEWHHGVT